jgi:hypothetical protein
MKKAYLMNENEKYFLNSLRYAPCHAVRSFLWSSGRITLRSLDVAVKKQAGAREKPDNMNIEIMRGWREQLCQDSVERNRLHDKNTGKLKALSLPGIMGNYRKQLSNLP